MEAIIKTIIFAVCFPLGMSLIYGLRRKIKGAKIVSDSNFVKVSGKKHIFIGIVNILLFPLGAMCFLGTFYELVLLFSSPSKVDWEILILQIGIIAVDSYYLHLFVSFRNKLEIIDHDTIQIYKGRKKYPLHKNEITYKCAENVIRLYHSNGKRIMSVTHLYENTQSLIKWLERSGEAAKNVNNVFYEYDTDDTEDLE